MGNPTQFFQTIAAENRGWINAHEDEFFYEYNSKTMCQWILICSVDGNSEEI